MERFSRNVATVVLSLGALSLAACGGEPEDSYGPTRESMDFVLAGTDVVGRYAEGTGEFESLSLAQVLEGESLVNRYEAKQRVKCVVAPCNPIDVAGRWAVSGAKLTLFPEGLPSVTYGLSWTDTSITLTDDQGAESASLKRVMPVPSDRGNGQASTP